MTQSTEGKDQHKHCRKDDPAQDGAKCWENTDRPEQAFSKVIKEALVCHVTPQPQVNREKQRNAEIGINDFLFNVQFVLLGVFDVMAPAVVFDIAGSNLNHVR